MSIPNEVSHVTRRWICPSEYLYRYCRRPFTRDFQEGLVIAVYFTNSEELCQLNEYRGEKSAYFGSSLCLQGFQESGETVVLGFEVSQASLMCQGTGDIAFANSGGTDDDDILLAADPQRNATSLAYLQWLTSPGIGGPLGWNMHQTSHTSPPLRHE